MRLRRAFATIVVCAASLGVVAAPAVAAQNPVIQDCLEHRAGLTGHYTVQQLRHALKVMPQYTQEYTSCPDVINRALLAALKANGNGSGGSGSFLPVPLLIVLVVVILAGGGFLVQAMRNRRRGG